MSFILVEHQIHSDPNCSKEQKWQNYRQEILKTIRTHEFIDSESGDYLNLRIFICDKDIFATDIECKNLVDELRSVNFDSVIPIWGINNPLEIIISELKKQN